MRVSFEFGLQLQKHIGIQDNGSHVASTRYKLWYRPGTKRERKKKTKKKKGAHSMYALEYNDARSVTVNKVDLDSESMPGSCSLQTCHSPGETNLNEYEKKSECGEKNQNDIAPPSPRSYRRLMKSIHQEGRKKSPPS